MRTSKQAAAGLKQLLLLLPNTMVLLEMMYGLRSGMMLYMLIRSEEQTLS